MLTGHLRTIYEETMGQVPLGPLLGKQNIQAKEVYSGYKIQKIFDGKIYPRVRTFNVKVHKSNIRVKRWHNKYEVLN